MAKVKSSKFGKVLSDIRQSNEQSGIAVSELRKDINALENNVLLIFEKIRRMEKGIAGQKRNNIVTNKTNVNTKISPANDESLLNDTSKDILVKMYNFMVRKSERDKVKENNDSRQKRLLEKKKEINYRKELIKAGLDPKLFKKEKGLLGKIGTGIKWSVFGAIGLGLAGLVWMFQEEVTSAGTSISNSLTELGQSIVKNFKFLKNIYDTFLEPIKKWFGEKIDKIGSYINENTNPLQSAVKDILEEVDNRLRSFSDSILDSITNWAQAVAAPLLNFYNNPMGSITEGISGIWDFISNHKALMAGFLGKFAAGPIGFAAKGFAGLTAFDTGKTTFETESINKRYTPEFREQTKKALESYSDEELWAKFPHILPIKEYRSADGTLDREKLVNDIINRKDVRKKVESSLTSDKTSPAYKKDMQLGKSLQARDDQLVEDVQKELGSNYVVRPKLGGYIVTDAKTGEELGSSDDIAIAFKRETGKLKEYLDKKRLEEKQRILDVVGPKLTQFDQALESYKSATIETAKNKVATVTSPVREATENVGKTLSQIQSPADALNMTADKVTQATDFANKGIQNLASKDLSFPMEQMFKSYNDMTSALGQLGDTASQFNSWDKISSFLNKLNPSERMDTIGQDPHEDIANQDALWNQAKEKIAPVNKVYNNKGSTTSHDNLDFPPVRHSGQAVNRIIQDTIWKPSVLR